MGTHMEPYRSYQVCDGLVFSWFQFCGCRLWCNGYSAGCSRWSGAREYVVVCVGLLFPLDGIIMLVVCRMFLRHQVVSYEDIGRNLWFMVFGFSHFKLYRR